MDYKQIVTLLCIFFSFCIMTTSIVSIQVFLAPEKPDFTVYKLLHSPGKPGVIISFNSSSEANYTDYVRKIDKFLDPYLAPASNPNKTKCSDPFAVISDNKYCSFNLTSLGHCNAANKYGYNKKAPCVFLRLNHSPDYYPDFYNDTKDLPSTMPKSLKEFIRLQKNRFDETPSVIWVHCEGVLDEDKEYIGPIQYLPYQGFPGYFFPLKGKEFDTNPVIAISFIRPMTHTVIEVACTAWEKEWAGGLKTTFELWVDGKECKSK